MYRRKNVRRRWSLDNMIQAVKTVRDGIPKREASRKYNVPRKTLDRYLRKSTAGEKVEMPPLGSLFPVFSRVQEDEMISELMKFSQSGYGLTSRDVRSLAFEKAEELGLDHPFNRTVKLAGKDWLKHFMLRNSSLALRKPEATSMARIKGFNRNSVQEFWNLLETVFNDHEYSASRIWNMDETGVSTVPTKASKIVAKKGQRHVAGISSGERGITTTVIFAMSAAGNYVPPFFIFPRQRVQESWKQGAPPDSKFQCSPRGWSTMETCNKWLDHFIEYVKPNSDAPVLLILDGHSTHTRNFSMLEKAKQNHVRVISMPPHTSHKLQPLDVAFMGPLKKNYSRAVELFLKGNPGQVVTLNNISALVKDSFVKSATLSTAMNGFKATGIFPFDPNIFTYDDFAASDALQAQECQNDSVTVSSVIVPEGDAIDSHLFLKNPPAVVELMDAHALEDSFENSSTAPNTAASAVCQYDMNVTNRQADHTMDQIPAGYIDLSLLSEDFSGPSNMVEPEVNYLLDDTCQNSIKMPVALVHSIINTDLNEMNIAEYQIVNANMSQMQGDSGSNLYLLKNPPAVVELVDAHFLEDSFESSFTVPNEAPVCNANLFDANVTNCQVFNDIADEIPVADWVANGLNSDLDCFVMNPEEYYVMDSQGKVTIQSHPDQTMTPSVFSDASNSQDLMKPKVKRSRWDKKSRNNTKPCDTDFQSSSLEISVNSGIKKRSKSSKKKEVSADLTSTTHRQKLLKLAAQKDLKLIKKAGRKGGKRTTAINAVEDILCSYCGTCFSTSDEGNGWLKCVSCQNWFHSECSASDRVYLECGNC
ncbi:uncharacterized protein LOC134223503 [Armigeres subalbatus]|uniref:uncharacterized protein LOC134223503 n=1 Tax=Armigeres subalbatus TaxID=124917 RepID=UPI002ED2EABC